MLVNDGSSAKRSLQQAISTIVGASAKQGARRPQNQASMQSSSSNPGALRLTNSDGGGRRSSGSSMRQTLSSNPGAPQITGDDDWDISSLVSEAAGNATSAVDAANAAADSKKAAMSEQQKNDEELASSDPEDQFYKDFNDYSANNLGGMGIYDFMVVDANSDADRDQWRSIMSDDSMGRYWEDEFMDWVASNYGDDDIAGMTYDQAIENYFNPWYDQKTSKTIDDVMTSQELQREYFNNSDGDTMNAIYQGIANDGFVPDVTGDTWRQEDMMNLYLNDPDLAAATMLYLYGVDALYNDEDLDLEDDPYAVDKLNDYLALGNMEFGTGDDYSTDVGELSDVTSFNAVNPDQYDLSIEKGWSSVPGYGIPVTGAVRSKMYDRYGVGYREKPEVTAAYQQAYGSEE